MGVHGCWLAPRARSAEMAFFRADPRAKIFTALLCVVVAFTLSWVYLVAGQLTAVVEVQLEVLQRARQVSSQGRHAAVCQPGHRAGAPQRALYAPTKANRKFPP